MYFSLNHFSLKSDPLESVFFRPSFTHCDCLGLKGRVCVVFLSVIVLLMVMNVLRWLESVLITDFSIVPCFYSLNDLL